MSTQPQQIDADEILVARIGRGEQTALARLYDRYASLVYAIAMRVVRDTTAAEDIVHDVFLQLWRKPSAFDDRRGRLPSWLTVITRNKAVDLLRKRRPETQLGDEPLQERRSSVPTYHHADFEKARGLMEALPPDQRRALEMAYLDGLTHAEIADSLGEPLGTVKSRIRLGLSTLKKALAQ